MCTVFGSFVDLDDPSRAPGVKFLQPTAKKLMRKELAYVVLGLLSDPPDLPMYRKVGEHPVTGFEITTSNRTTCPLEGYHTSVQRLSAKQGGKRMGRRLMRGKTREFNQNWNVKKMIRHGLMEDAGHHDYELLDNLHDIQQRLETTASSPATIPGVGSHRRTPRDAGVRARVVLPANATEKDWCRSNGITIAAPLTTVAELQAVLPHSSGLSMGNYSTAQAATGLPLSQKETTARVASIAGFQQSRSMLAERGHSARMKAVRAPVVSDRNVTARSALATIPTVAQQPALLPASSSKVPAPAARLDSLDETVAEDECDRDSDDDDLDDGDLDGGDDDDDDDDDGANGAAPADQQQPAPKRQKKEIMQEMRARRKKLRTDPNFGTAEERTAEWSRYNGEKMKKQESNRKRRR